MMKKYLNLILVAVLIIPAMNYAQPETSKLASAPGAFSRMGFGARGIGMGNALTAVTSGNLSGYYNPALAAFQDRGYFGANYSFLSLDRTLNFLNFTKKFEFGKNPKTGKARSTAGLSIGLINAGVDNIDGRDNQGRPTGALSTSENQVFLSLSNRFSKKFALGISFKFYYYKLYEDITSTGMGIDLGAVYLFNENLTAAFVLKDINSKYRWDTTDLYGQAGNTSEETFPGRKILAVSYYIPSWKIRSSVEWESSNLESNFFRLGLEAELLKELFVRGGIENFELSNSDIPISPSFGFSYFYKFGNYTAEFVYAFAMEAYSPFDRHIVGLSLLF